MDKNMIFEKLRRFLPVAFLTVILLMVFIMAVSWFLPVERSDEPSYVYEDSGLPGVEPGTADYGIAMPEIMPVPPDYYYDDVSGASDAYTSDAPRQVVRSGWLSIVVDGVEDAIGTLKDIAAQFEGRVDNVSFDQSSPVGKKHASVTIRVPNEKFDAAMERVKGVGFKVTSENISTVDVTEASVDIDARISNLELEEERYQKILKEAQGVDEIIQVSTYLSEIRGRIERLEARKNLLGRDIAMSTIAIDLESEPDVIVVAPTWSPWSSVKIAFLAVLTGLATFADFIIFFVILLLPLLVLWGGLIVFIVWIVRKMLLGMKRRMQGERMSSRPTSPPAPPAAPRSAPPSFNATTRSFPPFPASTPPVQTPKRRRTNGNGG